MPPSTTLTPLRHIVADTTACRDCQACTLACSLSHENVCDPRLARLVVNRELATGTVTIRFCHHCDPAPCVEICPTGALAPDRRGVVTLDEAACSRCGACADACPYDAIVYHRALGRYLKCDMCAGEASGPWCVALCAIGALALEDPPVPS